MSKLAIVFQPLHILNTSPGFAERFLPVVQENGYVPLVLDTSVACEYEIQDIHRIIEFWIDRYPQIYESSLVVGNALGGVVAHALSSKLNREARIITVSAPSKVTPELYLKFTKVIERTISDGSSSGMNMLEEYINTADISSVHSNLPEAQACKRIMYGLKAIANYECPCSCTQRSNLAIVGLDSRLSQADNICTCDNPSILEVPHAGMRPHIDNPEVVFKAVNKFLKGFFYEAQMS